LSSRPPTVHDDRSAVCRFSSRATTQYESAVLALIRMPGPVGRATMREDCGGVRRASNVRRRGVEDLFASARSWDALSAASSAPGTSAASRAEIVWSGALVCGQTEGLSSFPRPVLLFRLVSQARLVENGRWCPGCDRCRFPSRGTCFLLPSASARAAWKRSQPQRDADQESTAPKRVCSGLFAGGGRDEKRL
jgi:hypothetical protein